MIRFDGIAHRFDANETLFFERQLEALKAYLEQLKAQRFIESMTKYTQKSVKKYKHKKRTMLLVPFLIIKALAFSKPPNNLIV